MADFRSLPFTERGGLGFTTTTPRQGRAPAVAFAGGLSASERATAKTLSWRFLKGIEQTQPEDIVEVGNRWLGTDDGRWGLGMMVAVCMFAQSGNPKYALVMAYVHANVFGWWHREAGVFPPVDTGFPPVGG